MDSSSLSSRMKSKLSVRNPPLFKKPSKKNPNISLREVTIFKKASELSTLCDIEVCVLYYSREGQLIKTFPEDQSKVRDIAERFSQLSHEDKLKKSTTLSQFLNKKFKDELKRSLENNDGKVRQSLLELKDSLESLKQMFQDKKVSLLHSCTVRTETSAVSPDLSRVLNTVSSRMMKSKLSVRNPPRFKKPSKRNPNISLREVTIFKKGLELATLCGIELCVLYYSRDGELIKTYPEDQSKVRDIAERFSQLSDREKLKKSTTLAQFLNKKFKDELKRSLENNDGKVRQSLLELKDSLESGMQLLQDKKVPLLHSCTDQTETDLSPSLNTVDSQQLCTDRDLYSDIFTTDLSPSLIDDPYQQWPDSLTNHLCTELGQSQGVYSGRLISDLPPPLIDDPHQQWTGFQTDLSMPSSLNHPSNCSLFLYDHDNSTFTQLSSSFDQQSNDYGYSSLLLGTQGLGSCSNVHLPPQMQTHFDQFGTWNYNQTPCPL